MANVFPFLGIRYSPSNSSLDTVISPPYDVLSSQERQRLMMRDSHNITFVDSPEARPDDVPGVSDSYTRAAATLGQWLEDSTLIRDDHPCLYVVDHEFVGPGTTAAAHRRGIFLLLNALPWDESDVKRHEQTMAKPRADRLNLLRATRTQTSPIFTVWDDGNELDREIENFMGATPLLTAATPGEFGPEQIRLWRIEGQETTERITRYLAPHPLYIADGHHRYETAAAYSAESPEERPARVLSYCCSANDPGLLILATHRVIRKGVSRMQTVAELRERAGAQWQWQAIRTVAEAKSCLARPPAGDRHVAIVVAEDGIWAATSKRTVGASPRDALDVTVVDQELIPATGVGTDSANHGGLTFTHDPDEAVAAVTHGDAAFAFLLPAPTMRQIINVADAGETMPQKSTYFYPKVPTGLVMWRQDR